jgi:hypothetical protein
MSDATHEQTNRFSGVAPGRGTYSMAANTLLYKGQIVCKDSAGRAAVPGAGLPAVGVASSTFNNRTGAPSGGAADAMVAEVEYGVFGFAYTGTAPKPGDVLYVVDNQTLSLDPTASRGIAGICVETKNSLAYCYFGPLAIAAVGGATTIDVPLGSFRLSTGAAVAAFSAGVADGFVLDSSEGFGIRINDDSTTQFWSQVRLPESLPAGATLTLHVLASRVGSADAASATLTPIVYANREGVAFDAGSALTTGNFGLISGATKVVQELTKAIDQNGGAQAGDVLSIGLVAAAGLDDDDAIIHAVWISAR